MEVIILEYYLNMP